MNEDFVVHGGGTVKSLSDKGQFGGYLVLFDVVDLDNERFSKFTEYWLEDKHVLPLLFNHGLSQDFHKQKLTQVNFETKSQGLWIEGTLPIAESFKMELLWQAVKQDKLGLSSGATGHLVDRVRRRGATDILTWPIAEASLTPAPAQPRSRAVALKSLLIPSLLGQQTLNTLAEFERLRTLSNRLQLQ